MADLTFYYGTMESGKTTKLLQDNFNYRKHGFDILVVKPKSDVKGLNKIVNRQNETLEVNILLDSSDSLMNDNYFEMVKSSNILLVDEAQFFTSNQIYDFWFIAHFLNKPVICYGLKNNFKGDLFEGSSKLFSMADQKHELTVSCKCGNAAMFNARCVNNEFVSDGEEVVIDGEVKDVKYVPLCGDCYLKLVEKDKIKKYQNK